MDKRQLHHLWTRVRPIRPWYFLALAGLFFGLAVIGLRSNSLTMAQLRNDVYVADKHDQGIERALQNLQIYVTTHMNTNLASGPNAAYPPIQLTYTYDRAVVTAGEKATAANTKIYTDAQHYCEKVDSTDFYGTNRVPCVQQYVRSHGVDLPAIPDSLYKFDFVSPWWSPDFAGWSLVLGGLSFLAFVTFALTRWWLKRASK
jgi:hypothetical protein